MGKTHLIWHEKLSDKNRTVFLIHYLSYSMSITIPHQNWFQIVFFATPFVISMEWVLTTIETLWVEQQKTCVCVPLESIQRLVDRVSRFMRAQQSQQSPVNQVGSHINRIDHRAFWSLFNLLSHWIDFREQNRRTRISVFHRSLPKVQSIFFFNGWKSTFETMDFPTTYGIFPQETIDFPWIHWKVCGKKIFRATDPVTSQTWGNSPGKTGDANVVNPWQQRQEVTNFDPTCRNCGLKLVNFRKLLGGFGGSSHGSCLWVITLVISMG